MIFELLPQCGEPYCHYVITRSDIIRRMKTNSFNNLTKVSALVAITLVLPALTYAKDIKFEKWDKGTTRGQDGQVGR